MDEDFFARMRQRLEPSYLAASEPWQQSGFSGPEARWIALRKPVADCIDRTGSFGIDLSPPLIALAQRRLPALASRFTVANGASFRPPRRFDFVRTELCYVPAADEAAYLHHLLAHVVAAGGALLVCNYTEAQPDAATRILPGAHPATDLLARLATLGFTPESHRDGFDPIRNRRTRIALLRNH